MNKRLATATVIAATMALGLAGCSAETSAVPSTPTPSDSAAPAIEQGPVELTDEEAGARYLSIVCPSNQRLEALRTAVDAGEDEYLNGGAPDPTAIKAAAAEQVASTRLAIEFLDDGYFIWPTAVAEQLVHIRTSYMADLSAISAMSNASTYEEAYYVSWPAPTAEQQAAGQEVRYQLALEADTVASCAGYESAHGVLEAERDERLTALAEIGD